jgi:hypothetical protein
MSSITIHDLDHELDRKLTEEARRSKKSKNQTVKDFLARAVGMQVHGRYSDDYREFCGLWDADELKAFNNLQSDNSKIDAHFGEIDGLLRVAMGSG